MQKLNIPSFCDQAVMPLPGSHVVLGMSGGVDSSTTAAILKECGCVVHGIYLKLFDAKSVERAETDAKDVGALLGVPVETIDYREQFDKFVIRPFVEMYCDGKTPLPCAICNYEIKYRALCTYARQIGACFVATGHYAQKMLIDGIVALCPAEDKSRDQSYFMFGLRKEQLEMAVFPLGRAVKTHVRQYAKEYGLHVSQKPDSQDICFLSEYNGQYVAFIKEFIANHPQINLMIESGSILDENSNIIGKHEGAINYTIGQRRGLGISAANPLYVFKIRNNDVFVGNKDKLIIKKTFIKACNYHPLAIEILSKDAPVDVYAQYRSTMSPIKATFEYSDRDSSDGIVTFETGQYGVSPGQAVVFRTQDGVVLGGGWIDKTENT
ncbi:MAG: tRNA 2-thiouridine(34) synthase MnmA [Holosporales bacterium]|jgi:tRNA-specific 2-thiouridylase|nr:tRNA 2-thiouridine(34) synthase MnmA [Holosporales bacterium]